MQFLMPKFFKFVNFFDQFKMLFIGFFSFLSFTFAKFIHKARLGQKQLLEMVEWMEENWGKGRAKLFFDSNQPLKIDVPPFDQLAHPHSFIYP